MIIAKTNYFRIKCVKISLPGKSMTGCPPSITFHQILAVAIMGNKYIIYFIIILLLFVITIKIIFVFKLPKSITL